MEIDLRQPKTRLCDQYLTVTGLPIDSRFSSYFEMYRDTFLDRLEGLGISTDAQLKDSLERVAQFEGVGDFIVNPEHQGEELAAFGLLLLDRIVRLDWGRLDPDTGFFLHEQMFECFEYARDASRRSESARRLVNLKYPKNRAAQRFVISEWVAHRGAYEGNKSAFARDYVRRVKNEFDLVVTEKQMREVWLRDAPSTGKPSGLPVDGE